MLTTLSHWRFEGAVMAPQPTQLILSLGPDHHAVPRVRLRQVERLQVLNVVGDGDVRKNRPVRR